MTERKRPIVLAAPSGTGKTTIAHRLIDGTPEFVFSVSATTRKPRKGERNGMDYEFMGRPEFEAMRDRGELAEWAEVHGNLYGTPMRNFEEATERLTMQSGGVATRLLRRFAPRNDASSPRPFPPRSPSAPRLPPPRTTPCPAAIAPP